MELGEGEAQRLAGFCVLYTTAHPLGLEPGVQRFRAKAIEKVLPFVHDGGGEGIRTPDPLRAKQAAVSAVEKPRVRYESDGEAARNYRQSGCRI